MNVSATIELVWQLAGQEAIAGRFKEIEPDHFCLALLKFSELPVEEVDKVAKGAEVARELASEVNTVREELESRSIDSTHARRELRAKLGKGHSEYDGGRMHRSQASRDLFDTAARMADDAGAETLLACHLIQTLLSSPTPAMTEVLGDSIRRKPAKRSKSPLLDEYGQDLTRMAAEGKVSPVSGWEAECKVLFQVLGQKDKKSALVVSDNEDAVCSVMKAAACAMTGKKALPEMKNRRIVDISNMKLSGKDAKEGLERMERLLVEAAAAEGVILFGPAIEQTRGTNKPSDWVELLKAMLTKGAVQCVCRITPAAYHQWVEKDRAWRRLAKVIWIQDKKKDDEIPDEL